MINLWKEGDCIGWAVESQNIISESHERAKVDQALINQLLTSSKSLILMLL
jgi:hypothetical protein